MLKLSLSNTFLISSSAGGVRMQNISIISEVIELLNIVVELNRACCTFKAFTTPAYNAAELRLSVVGVLMVSYSNDCTEICKSIRSSSGPDNLLIYLLISSGEQ